MLKVGIGGLASYQVAHRCRGAYPTRIWWERCFINPQHMDWKVHLLVTNDTLGWRIKDSPGKLKQQTTARSEASRQFGVKMVKFADITSNRGWLVYVKHVWDGNVLEQFLQSSLLQELQQRWRLQFLGAVLKFLGFNLGHKHHYHNSQGITI